jgi:predicted O-methyltransferase YrrM
LVNPFGSQQILEIGTSLGITTLYLASAHSKSRVVTIEGCPNTAAAAQKNFEKAGTKNIEQVIGEFKKSLPEALSRFTALDFVYFDGNHRKQPTLHYFHECLKLHHESSVFIFDDIYWSSEMSEAWLEIKNHPSVTLSVDLYSTGIIFFRHPQPRQHFRLRF